MIGVQQTSDLGYGRDCGSARSAQIADSSRSNTPVLSEVATELGAGQLGVYVDVAALTGEEVAQLVGAADPLDAAGQDEAAGDVDGQLAGGPGEDEGEVKPVSWPP